MKGLPLRPARARVVIPLLLNLFEGAVDALSTSQEMGPSLNGASTGIERCGMPPGSVQTPCQDFGQAAGEQQARKNHTAQSTYTQTRLSRL